MEGAVLNTTNFFISTYKHLNMVPTHVNLVTADIKPGYYNSTLLKLCFSHRIKWSWGAFILLLVCSLFPMKSTVKLPLTVEHATGPVFLGCFIGSKIFGQWPEFLQDFRHYILHTSTRYTLYMLYLVLFIKYKLTFCSLWVGDEKRDPKWLMRDCLMCY